MFKDTVIKRGDIYSKALEEVFDEPKRITKKLRQRKRIDDEVFDVYDSIADTNKWLSLLTTLCSRLYDIMPEARKDLLAPADRYLIEYIFAKFAITNTIADVKLQQEGVAMIDRLLDRQKAVGEIVS